MAAEEPPLKRSRPNSVEDVALHQDKQTAGPKTGGMTLTVKEIAADKLTKIAEENWSEAAKKRNPPVSFQPDLVKRIYMEELGGSSSDLPSLKRVMLLEISQYLENYLWPHFDADSSSDEHVLSIILMVNEKFRENVPPWACFHTDKDRFEGFFRRFLQLKSGYNLKMHEKTTYLMFTINTFQSLEEEMVRGHVLRLVSLPLWHALSPGRLQLELHAHPNLMKLWKKLLKRESKGSKGEKVPVNQRPESSFIPALCDEFLEVLQEVAGQLQPSEVADGNGAKSTLSRRYLLYCERFVEFMIDLLSQLPTRRFVRAVVDDRAVLIKSKLSALFKHQQAGHLFRQLVDLFSFYLTFPIDDHTGEPLSEDSIISEQYEKLCQLQRLLFKHWSSNTELKELALMNCGHLEKREVIKQSIGRLKPEQLRKLVVNQLRLVADGDEWTERSDFLLEVLIAAYGRRQSQREVINQMPLYPTENILWDEGQIPSVNYTGEGCLALPKLNLQFLTPHDYLLRNFHLFRLEAAYEIREDIADVMKRIGAKYDLDQEQVVFKGWARMAQPIESFKIVEVKKPNVGENKPAGVTAEIVINTKMLRGDVRGEWDELKQHDVLFLLGLHPSSDEDLPDADAENLEEQGVAERYGLTVVRGCEVIEVKDERGHLMNDFTGRVKPDERKMPEGFLRTLVVALDTAQYQLDMNYMVKEKTDDIYATFNVVMRRKPKENNFKAVLESIRDIMNEDIIIPTWLHDIFLGYGDPAAAKWTSLDALQQLHVIDFKDTFLDTKHVEESFPGCSIEWVNKSKNETLQPPFRISFSEAGTQENGTANGGSEAAATTTSNRHLKVEAYTPPDPGPYPKNRPRTNSVRFTPVQVDAIMSGVQPGLTMVVGPPGTGKTDTAVQIMHVLYHNCPEQRTLLITHSNQALNDLFIKCMERDIPARYLLRLGMGEQDLDTDLDFSRVGRVNAMLARRLELLAEVERMARIFGVIEDVAYTCETASYFWLLHVLSRWEKFSAQVAEKKTPECVADLFPFSEYFSDAPQPLFKKLAFEDDLEKARGCFRHLKTMFQELEEIRPFELLKGQQDRVNYLMLKHAKIVAMTCTHAALKRHEFLNLGLKYDNLVMEESAQILEVETFIPMVLQRAEDGVARLKRVVLIGDHHQLPPVVKNMAFQKFSHLDQPLFTRFIRLGTPYIQLNAQGRARPSIAKLYNWRYDNLGDLPVVQKQDVFHRANPGFAFDYQFIDVPDFKGVGESEPVQYFYQNLGEAEYLVSVYQFMRLLGYPAEKISILTTYNGQKALLRDVIERRCARHPLFGRPAKVSTVDKYQGQQNDYVLLSLVRTRVVGHLRDVRRLVVAMSRARLGLYVFGRKDLFGNCYELKDTFQQLLARPCQLALVKGEDYEQCDRKVGDKVEYNLISGVEEMTALAAQVTYEQQVAGVEGA